MFYYTRSWKVYEVHKYFLWFQIPSTNTFWVRARKLDHEIQFLSECYYRFYIINIYYVNGLNSKNCHTKHKPFDAQYYVPAENNWDKFRIRHVREAWSTHTLCWRKIRGRQKSWIIHVFFRVKPKFHSLTIDSFISLLHNFPSLAKLPRRGGKNRNRKSFLIEEALQIKNRYEWAILTINFLYWSSDETPNIFRGIPHGLRTTGRKIES